MISIRKMDDERYEVIVAGASTTTHEVTLTDAYWRKLTGERETPEKLIERSFEFLLEREPNTAILRRFELPVIERYFPGFEKSIKAAR